MMFNILKIKQHMKSIPVNLDNIVRDLDITLKYENLDDDICGIIVKSVDTDGVEQYTIKINGNHPHNRKRFTLAHEIGHYMLHRNLIGIGLNDNKAYRTTNTTDYYNDAITEEHEAEANRFAANLLMPDDKVQEMRKLGITQSQMAKMLDVNEQAVASKLR